MLVEASPGVGGRGGPGVGGSGGPGGGCGGPVYPVLWWSRVPGGGVVVSRMYPRGTPPLPT